MNRRAFTMVEMMVTVAIMGIVTAGLVTVFQKQRLSKPVEMVAYEIGNKLAQARADTISPPQDVFGLTGLKVGIKDVGGKKVIYEDFASSPDIEEKIIYEIPKNVNAANFESTLSTQFGPTLGQCTTCGGIIETTVTDRNNQVSFKITLYLMSGLFEVEKI